MKHEAMQVRDVSAGYARQVEVPVVPEGYKQTEVGVIPEDWEVCPLVNTCVSNGIVRGPFGGALKKDIFVSSGFKVYEQRNAIYKSCDIGRYYIDRNKYNEMQRFSVSPGDFIVSCSGTIGRIYQIPRDAPQGVINQALLKLTTDDAVVSSQYFYIVFGWENFQALIIDGTQGGAMKNLVGMSVFKTTPVILPPPPEQRAIATALSDVDALLEALDRLIAKKRDIKQATMQQLLTAQTRLPGFEGEWERVRLGDHVTFLKNGVNSRAELRRDGQVRYLHYGDIHASGSVLKNPDSLPFLPDAKAKTLARLQNGDLIFADASEDIDGVGKSVELVGIASNEMVSGLHTIAARFDKAILADGFKAYLQFCPDFISTLRRLAAGTKVYATTRSHIAGIEMRLPKVEEQQAISGVFSAMDSELEALQKRRTKTAALKQAMMQELLTGRTRLEDPTPKECANG